MEQEAVGLPDQKSDLPVRQKLVLDGERNRLILTLFSEPAGGDGIEGGGGGRGGGAAEKEDQKKAPEEVDRRVILRMDYDPPEIYEIWDARRTYRKTNQDLNRIQEERDKQEATWLRHLGSMSAAERKNFLEENHLSPDGKRHVEVVRGGTKKILGYDCQEVTVRENGRAVMHVWVTRDVAGARSFFHLYRKLGAFSKEVLEKVAALEGLPLEAEITVVTQAPEFKISAKCLSVKVEEVPDTAFELPAGYQERKDDLPALVKCPDCGKEVEPDRAQYKIKNLGAETLYFCSRPCWERYRKEADKRERAREAALGGEAGGKSSPVNPGSGPPPKK
jgi:YHS domain-containing protein